MKNVEYSEDDKTWVVIGEWSDEEAEEKFEELTKWIHETQVFGFFRMVDKK